jgi:hypothetical protein
MKPIRLILGVEAASTFGGMLTDVAMSDARDRIESRKTQNLLLAIRTYDYGQMLITLSGVAASPAWLLNFAQTCLNERLTGSRLRRNLEQHSR